MGVAFYPMRPVLGSPPPTTAVLTALVCLAAALGLWYGLAAHHRSETLRVTRFPAVARHARIEKRADRIATNGRVFGKTRRTIEVNDQTQVVHPPESHAPNQR